MAMNAGGLAGEIEALLQAKGIVTNNEHSRTKPLCEAIAEAVVAHIQANAKVIDTGGTAPAQHYIT